MPQSPSDQTDSVGGKVQLPFSILIAHSLGGIHVDHRKQEKSEEEPKDVQHVNMGADMGHDNTAIGWNMDELNSRGVIRAAEGW